MRVAVTGRTVFNVVDAFLGMLSLYFIWLVFMTAKACRNLEITRDMACGAGDIVVAI